MKKSIVELRKEKEEAREAFHKATAPAEETYNKAEAQDLLEEVMNR